MNIATATPAASRVERELVASATALIPILRARSGETAALAKLPEATVADLKNARIFDMMVPGIYGGLQTSLRTLMEVIVQLARGDGSVAWTVDLLSSGTWSAAALFPKSVTDVVFAPGGNARVAGSMNLSNATARRVDGGILIEDGAWRFNSGAHHAGWDILGFPVANQAGDGIDRINALVPISDVTLSNDWDTSGLRGSGSTSITVKDLFVPNERLVNLGKCLKEEYGAIHLQYEPLYQMPIVAVLAIKLVLPALGMAKAALDLFVEKAAHRSIAFTPYDKQNEAVITHLQVAEASMKIDMAELLLQRAAEEIDSIVSTGSTATVAVRLRIRRDAGYANRLIWEAMDGLASASGGSFASVENGMNRIWQDVRVASLHGGANSSTALELYGRVLCGLEPNTPLI